MAYGDLNNDSLEDIVVCEFGNKTGRLSWYDNDGKGGFVKRILRDKPGAVVLAKKLIERGFELAATDGTARVLTEAGLECKRANKVREGRPHIVDMIKNGKVQMIITTPSGMVPRRDENVIRSAAYAHNVCIMTTITGAYAALHGIKAIRQKRLTARSLQSFAGNTVPV